MGISDCVLFFSKNLSSPMESNSLSKPTSEFQENTQAEDKPEEISVSLLRIKTPSRLSSVGEFKDDEGGDTCTTPTSLDRRIPVVPPCPPAPRKPKSVKRKAANSRRILLDYSSEVESLFPVCVVADFGGKIKKARQD